MNFIYPFLVFCCLFIACKESGTPGSDSSKKTLTIENLQGSWTSKPGGPAELKFEQDSIHFLEDQQSFKYIIVGDSIQFELQFATFWYKVELKGEDRMSFTTPQMPAEYYRVKN